MRVHVLPEVHAVSKKLRLLSGVWLGRQGLHLPRERLEVALVSKRQSDNVRDYFLMLAGVCFAIVCAGAALGAATALAFEVCEFISGVSR